MSKFQFEKDHSFNHQKVKDAVFTLRNKSEVEIWEDFLEGDDSALVYLYRSYTNKLYNYGRQVLDDDAIVCDAIQDLFFNLIRSRTKIGKTSSVKNYLYASLRRKLIRIKQRVDKQISDNTPNTNGQFLISILKDDHTPMDQFTSEQKQMLEDACNGLPVRQREAILLLYFEEMSYKEVAEILEIPKIRSVRALVYRAIESLRNALSPFKNELLLSLWIIILL